MSARRATTGKKLQFWAVLKPEANYGIYHSTYGFVLPLVQGQGRSHYAGFDTQALAELWVAARGPLPKTKFLANISFYESNFGQQAEPPCYDGRAEIGPTKETILGCDPCIVTSALRGKPTYCRNCEAL